MSQQKRVFVTKEELTVERTPKELVKWVERKIQEITQKEGGQEALRMRKGFCKELLEEVYALSIWASFQFDSRNDVTLQPEIGNQPYDALITDHAFSPPSKSKLEITQAHEGEKNFLRHFMLQEEGWAPAFGSIVKTGTKNKGIEAKASFSVREVKDYLNEQINLISDALERKLQNEYDSNTSLLIMFDAITSYKTDDLREELYDFVEDELGPKATKFSALYVVSWSKRIFLKWLPNNDG